MVSIDKNIESKFRIHVSLFESRTRTTTGSQVGYHSFPGAEPVEKEDVCALHVNDYKWSLVNCWATKYKRDNNNKPIRVVCERAADDMDKVCPVNEAQKSSCCQRCCRCKPKSSVEKFVKYSAGSNRPQPLNVTKLRGKYEYDSERESGRYL